MPLCYSLDVPCVFKDPKTYDNTACHIKQTINVLPGDKLNLTNSKEIDGILYFYLNSPSTIHSFPIEIFEQLPSLQNVFIDSDVGLKNLSRDSFKGGNKLKKLAILRNKIKNIPANMISETPELDVLYLSNNEIDNIESEAFTSSNLRRLELDNNKLVTLRSGIFSGSLGLQFINFNHNSIENIEEGVFNVPKLKGLNLSENRLRTVPLNLLANVPNLVWLNFASNQLIGILNVLEKAPALKSLILDDNPNLTDINLISMRRLPQLDWLNITNINLTSPSVIPDSLESSELTNLHLSRNKFSDSGLLRQLNGLKKLRHLNLEENEFTKLDEFDRIKQFLPALRVIWFKGNNWDSWWPKLARNICLESNVFCFGL